MQPSPRHPTHLNGQRVDIKVDVKNVTGHALDVLAHIRDPVNKEIYKYYSRTKLRLKSCTP